MGDRQEPSFHAGRFEVRHRPAIGRAGQATFGAPSLAGFSRRRATTQRAGSFQNKKWNWFDPRKQCNAWAADGRRPACRSRLCQRWATCIAATSAWLTAPGKPPAAAAKWLSAFSSIPHNLRRREDLAKYPRDLMRDKKLCAAAGVDVLFIPPEREMYPPDFSTYVVEEKLARGMEGTSASRRISAVWRLSWPSCSTWCFRQWRFLARRTFSRLRS